MALLLLLAVAGPAETIAGKYAPPRAAPPPLPEPLPRDVETLERLIRAGHRTTETLAALGEALLARGEKRLAYWALHLARREGHADPGRLQRMMDEAERVPEEEMARREKGARVWTSALEGYVRAEGDEDLAAFYERYGREEDDVFRHMRIRRASFLGGVLGVFAGAAAALSRRRARRRWAAVPLALAALLALAPAALGQVGLFYWGAGAAAAGGLALLARGRHA